MEGGPQALDDSALIYEIRQAREKLAEQAHPHEKRAKILHEALTGRCTQGEASDQAGRGCGNRDKRREHNEGKDRTNKTVSFNDYERGNIHPINMHRGGYESMDYEMETRSKSEACPHGCGYSSMDVDLV